MKRLTVIALLLALIPAGTATANTHIGNVTGPWQQWVDKSLAPTPDMDITVLTYGCPVAAACYIPATGQIELLPTTTRSTFLHELGHAFDFANLTDANRARFANLYGKPSSPWLGTPDTPGEWFADNYTACALRGRVTKARPSRYLFHDWRMINRGCRLIETIGGRGVATGTKKPALTKRAGK